MDKKSNSFFVYLVGVATGTLLGVLFAPDKGENTRDKLSFQLDKYSKKLDELAMELMDEKEDTGNEAKSKGEKIVSNAKEKAEKLLDDVNGLISKIKNKDK